MLMIYLLKALLKVPATVSWIMEHNENGFLANAHL